MLALRSGKNEKYSDGTLQYSNIEDVRTEMEAPESNLREISKFKFSEADFESVTPFAKKFEEEIAIYKGLD